MGRSGLEPLLHGMTWVNKESADEANDILRDHVIWEGGNIILYNEL